MAWSYSDYQRAADAAWIALDSSVLAAVISFGQDGGSLQTSQYGDSDEASGAYDQVVNSPADRYYVALYDRQKQPDPSVNNRVDETYFGGMQPGTKTVTKLGPIAAVVATAAALGLSVFAAGKRKRR